MKAKRVRFIDIAERCGVSKSAVARALGRPFDRSELSHRTYERIHLLAREMGYRAPRGSEAPRTPPIAIIYPARGAPALFGIQGHISAILITVLADMGYDTVFLRCDGGKAWADRLLEQAIRGVAVFDPPPDGLIEGIARVRLPCVAFEACHDLPVPRVLFDDRGNGRLLTEQLLKLGHRRIDYLAGSGDTPSCRLRVAGWGEAMASSGARGELLKWGKAEHVPSLVARLRSKDAPTAIIGYADGEALAVLQIANSMGIAVPERLSIVGCNASFTPSWPPLASLQLHPDHVAKAGAQLLDDLILGRASAPSEPIFIGGTYQPGASTAAPAKRRPRP